MLTLGHQRASSHGSRLIAFLAAPQQKRYKTAFFILFCVRLAQILDKLGCVSEKLKKVLVFRSTCANFGVILRHENH